MNYPIYHFDCNCNHEEGSENILKTWYNKITHKQKTHITCKLHLGVRLLQRTFECQEEGCENTFTVSVKANNALYCIEHQKVHKIRKRVIWRQQHPGYYKRFYLSRTDKVYDESEVMVDVPDYVIYPEVDRRDISPCIQGEGCSHRYYDKNNKICTNCALRIAFAISDKNEFGKMSIGSEREYSGRAYKAARS